jgi:hypothetical protein
MIVSYLMMIQLAGIHNGFHNKNHLDNIDIVGIDIVGIDNMKVVEEHTEVAGEHTEVVEEHTEVVEEHTEVDGNRQIAEVQQHWQG